jgi:uncharacterized protein (TIGR02266 family)
MDRPESPRRRHRRHPLRIPIRISTIDPEPDPWTGRPCFRTSRETCTNVSTGGLFVHTDEPFSPGRRVLVEMQLPDGRPVEAVGRVAWTKKVLQPGGRATDCGVGIAFETSSRDELVPLDDFLEHADSRHRGRGRSGA